MYDLSDKNMLIGVHLSTGYPIDIHLTNQEMVLATLTQGDINSAWESMCALVLRRTGIEIIGQIQIDSIVINGNKRKFH
jgi:hypothetical protein